MATAIQTPEQYLDMLDEVRDRFVRLLRERPELMEAESWRELQSVFNSQQARSEGMSIDFGPLPTEESHWTREQEIEIHGNIYRASEVTAMIDGLREALMMSYTIRCPPISREQAKQAIYDLLAKSLEAVK